MYTLKGFIGIQALANNTPDQVATIGELSTKARTYSKDTGTYNNALYADVDLISFYSVDDVSGVIEVPTTYSSKSLEVSQWMYGQAEAAAFTAVSSDCLAAVQANFLGDITDITVGAMVEYSAGKLLPEWIQFSVEPIATTPNVIKIWFSDAAFKTQYDEFEIVVVPMVDNVDSYIDTFLNVKAVLDAEDYTTRMQRMQTAIGNYPPTILKSVEYNWIDQVDPNLNLTSPWGILIYGVAGDNVDSIKAAIAAAVLAASVNNAATWELYIPDLFKSTEFVVIPMWQNYSIPNQTLLAGLFSPTVDYNDILTIANAGCVGYDPTHISNNIQSSVAYYRSTSFLAIGGIDNRDGIIKFKDQFSDYFVVPTTSVDFSRMSVDTQNWIILLTEMLAVAAEMTTYSDLPAGMSRLFRGSVMYLVANYQDIQYLVLSRQSYDALFPVV